MSGNCIQRPLRPLRLQSATLERQNAEFIDCCCEQAKALIELFKSISVLGKFVTKLPLTTLQPHFLDMTETQHVAKVAREYLTSQEKVRNDLRSMVTRTR
jgi:hypothetical protein